MTDTLSTEQPELVFEVRRADGGPLTEADLARAEAATRVAVVREPLTYERHGQHSYFADMVASVKDGDIAAITRLQRHATEVRVEHERRTLRMNTDLDYEYRANPDRTQGQGGYFAPPLWLIDQFATAPRPGRVLAAAMPGFDLPTGVQSVSLPLVAASGTSTTEVADLTAATSADLTDSALTSEVVTIAGTTDVALQLLEQSPRGAHFDWATFTDLMADYDAQLERQLINGSGSAGQLQGLLGIGHPVTYTDAAPKATAMFPFLGQAVAAVGNQRQAPPEMWLLRTSRIGWLGSAEDSSNRPLGLANSNGAGEFDILTFPARPDDAVSANLNGNQDTIIACRPSDGILLESGGRTEVMFDVKSGTLQARLQFVRYVAALQRYPSGVAYLTGTGMVVQPGF